MDTAKKIRRISLLVVLLLLTGTVAMVLRGPHVSNALKKMILPEIEMATGYRVIAKNIYINIFPFFIEAKSMKMFDDEGKRIFFAERVKAYLDISGIFDRNLIIRRLVIKEPELNTDRQEINEIIDNVKMYLSQKRENKINLEIKAVEVQEGKADYIDPGDKTVVAFYGFAGEVILGEIPKVRTSARKVTVKREGWPQISAAFSSAASLHDSALTVKSLIIRSLGSELTASGEYTENVLEGKTRIKLLVRTLKEMFHLESSGDGHLDAKGSIAYRDSNLIVDMRLSGEFYLQTLMELLKVREKIEGLVDVSGEIKGPVNNIKGTATASLHGGNLYGVDIASLTSIVSYADGVMSLTNAQGKIYGGQAKASASIALPAVNSFSLDIAFVDVDSLPLFKLIGWDPGIQPGKVAGTLRSSGGRFNPAGHFQYRSIGRGNNVLGRIRDIEGTYSMEGGSLLTLSEMNLHSEKTAITARGLVDLEEKTLNLGASLKSSDVRDLTLPYYDKIQGTGEYSGTVTGPFSDLVISGRVKINDSIIDGYRAGLLDADVVYRKALLHINEFVVSRGDELHRLTGDVYFRDAKNLFELSGAEYKLRAKVKNALIDRFVKMFYPDFIAEGMFSSDITIRGSSERPDIYGKTTLLRATLYNIPFDSASFDLAYKNNKLSLSNVMVEKGNSHCRGDFTLYPDGTFSYKASSDNLMISDLIQKQTRGDAVLSFKSEGSGAFDNPTIAVDATIKDTVLRGRHIGGGVLTASIRGKNISANAKLFNEKISVKASGRLEGEMPWDATVNVETARYDFLITSFLKDVPEDLVLSLNGTAMLHGTRNRISVSSSIKHMVISMYGQSFTNEEEISLYLKDREISVESIAMRSGNTLLRAGGTLTIGKSYDLIVEGNSALSPFKSLSAKLGVLRGNAEFIVSVTGGWENPKINGGVTLVKGTVGLKEYPAHRITDLNGYLYMDNDRVVLQDLSGKIGGGDIEFSGILYLKRFAFSRFYIEAKMKNVTSSISNEFSVNFDGNLLYKGTPEAQLISGNIDINRARYRERIEWKSWLLEAKKAETLKTDISNLEKADLNIKVTGKNNIVIDNNVARAVVGVDMVLRGKLYRPSLLGRFETSEGKVFFRNNEFNIRHASADFSDPNRLNPFISIAADTDVKGYRVKMNLEGQLDHFSMSLSSDPPLKEMDILALLTVGQTGSGVKGLEAGIGAGEATSFVTGKMQDVFEERLRSITGLDRFQVDPYVSKTTGTVEPRVTVSKRLMGDKVFVTYTTAVGTIEEQIIKLEFFMTKNVSLVGVRDERGIAGGDIRFRFEFK